MVSIEWLNSLESGRDEVGDKAFFLNKLSDLSGDLGFSIPQGFILPKEVMDYFFESNSLKSKISRIVSETDQSNYQSLQNSSQKIQETILNADVPEEIEEAVKEAYEKIGLSGEVRNAGGNAVDLVGSQRESQFVSVRSSVPREKDVCDVSLNVNGKKSVMMSIKKVYASLFSPEALFCYDEPLNMGIGIIVQRMLEPEKSASLFTRNPCNGDSSQIVVEGVWGIGNSLSSGSVFPDLYLISKDSGNLTEKEIVEKNWELKINSVSGELVKERVPQDRKYKRVLTRSELSKLVNLSIRLEEKFSFGKINVSLKRDKIRLLGVEKTKEVAVSNEEIGEEPFLKGRGASPGIEKGELKLIYDDSDQESIEEGDILVTLNPGKEFIPSLNKISGFVAEEGSISSNFTSIAREFGVPVIVGAKNATDMLTPEEKMSIDGSKGQIFEEVDVKKEEKVREVETDFKPNVTATDLRVSSSRFHPESEGVLVKENLEREEIKDLADKYEPLPVWLNQPPIRERENNFWDSENSGIVNIGDNVGYLSDMDNLDGLRSVNRKGVLLDDFASIMQLEEIRGRIDIAVIDLSSLVRNSGKGYDHPAVNNAINKLVKFCGENCESSLFLEKIDPRVVRKAIKAGIDSLTVNPEKIGKAKNMLAKEEKRFMLEKLREL